MDERNPKLIIMPKPSLIKYQEALQISGLGKGAFNSMVFYGRIKPVVISNAKCKPDNRYLRADVLRLRDYTREQIKNRKEREAK
jgi:hypothetical protein